MSFSVANDRSVRRGRPDNNTAVADGLALTARVITAAALIMFCVFGAFVLGDDRSLKLFGLGLAVAVPAVLAYNFLISRNKTAMSRIRAFASDVHGFLIGGKISKGRA